MGKTNFSKVEKALEDGMRQIEVDKLHAAAKAAKTAKDAPAAQSTGAPDLAAPQSAVPESAPDTQRQRQQALKLLLDWLWKYDKKLFERLGVEPAEAQRLVEAALPLSQEDGNKFNALYKKAETQKTNLEAKLGATTDEKLIEQQRTEHINKRFNIGKNWLPLH